MEVDARQEDLSCLDGPWRNDACMGYAVMAMERAGLNAEKIKTVLEAMNRCFEDTSVSEAAQYYIDW